MWPVRLGGAAAGRLNAGALARPDRGLWRPEGVAARRDERVNYGSVSVDGDTHDESGIGGPVKLVDRPEAKT